MSDYSSATVPKALGRQSSNLYSFMSTKWAMVAIIWALVLTFIILAAMQISIVFYCAAVVWTAAWVNCCRTTAKIDKTVLVLKFLLRSKAGHTILPKYDLAPEYLEQHFPLKKIHSEGLIEFGNHIYGVLMKMDPSRINDGDLPAHLASVQAALNSIPPGDVFKTFACSRLNMTKPFTNRILEAANNYDTTAAQQRHLYSLHKQVSGSDRDTVDWHFWALLCFPAQDSVENAIITRQTRLPGLKKMFQKAGVGLYPITDPTEILLAYYQMLRQEEIRI
jgi:hypothetical protein